MLKNKRFLAFLFGLSFLMRGLFFGGYLSKPGHGLLEEGRFWNFDSPAYHDVAVKISSGEGIINADGSAHYYRVPGYSLFLATWYKIFGVNKLAALWIQVLLACFIPVLIFILAQVIFSNLLLAKIASLWSVFHLGLVMFSGFFMTETFFTIFFLLFLIFFFPSFNLFFQRVINVSHTNFFISGLFLGIASLFRPVGHYLIIAALLLLIASSFSIKNKCLSSVMILLGWGIVVAWLLIRNCMLTGYLFFHTLPGVHYLNHSVVRLVMDKEKISHSEALKSVYRKQNLRVRQKEESFKRPLLEIEWCLVAEKLFKEHLFDDYLISFKHVAINMLKTCFSLYSSELLFIESGGDLPTYNKRGIIDIFKRFLFPSVRFEILLLIYLEIITFLFVIVGFLLFLYRSLFSLKLLSISIKVLIFSAIFIGVSGACGFARLRLSIEPLLFICSLYYWLKLFYKRVEGKLGCLEY